MKFKNLYGCPDPASIAPYHKRVLDRAGLRPSSIGRGNEPQERRILHAHGKHSQVELANATPAQRRAWGITGTPNRPGHSGHERRNDDGSPQPEWAQAVDCGPNTDETRTLIRRSAAHYGWKVVFPYNSLVEYHHWRFAKRPRPRNPRQFLNIVRERRALPNI